MKKGIIFLFILISVNMFSKDRINIKLKQQEIRTAMALISKQTGMSFAYNPQTINTAHIISIDIVDKEISEAINLLLTDFYTYTIKGKYIIITSEKRTIKKPIDDKEADRHEAKHSIQDSGISSDDGLINIKEMKPVLKKIESGKPSEITNTEKEPTMLKKAASIIALSALTAMPANVASQPEPKPIKVKRELNPTLPKSIGQISFLYPLSTDGGNTKEKEYKFSFNIIGGVTGGVNGVELGGVFNINKGDVRGFQAAGVFNATRGLNQGIQFGGAINYADISQGIQIAGAVNYAKTSSDIQFSGAVNYTKEYSLLQVSGFANYAKYAGVQISVVNITKKAGFQMGVINLSESDETTMLGLLNFVKNGGLFEIGVSSNDYIYGAVNLVTGTDILYSVLSLGFHPSSVSIGTGLGTRIQLGSTRGGINLELMHNQLYKDDFKDSDINASLEQFRAFYAYRMNRFTLYGGPTVNVLLRDLDFTNAKEPIYSIYSKTTSNHNIDSWVGAEIGVRFNLKK